MERISVTFDSETLDMLDEMATNEDRSRSAMLRKLVKKEYKKK